MVVGAEADSSSGPRMERMTGRRMRPCQRPNTTVSKNTCTQKHHPQQKYLHKKTTPLARIPAHKTHHHQQEDLHGSQHLPLEGIPKLHGAQITRATGIPAQFTKNHSLQENLHSAQTPSSAGISAQCPPTPDSRKTCTVPSHHRQQEYLHSALTPSSAGKPALPSAHKF